jgi:hypothetical protein
MNRPNIAAINKFVRDAWGINNAGRNYIDQLIDWIHFIEGRQMWIPGNPTEHGQYLVVAHHTSDPMPCKDCPNGYDSIWANSWDGHWEVGMGDGHVTHHMPFPKLPEAPGVK